MAKLFPFSHCDKIVSLFPLCGKTVSLFPLYDETVPSLQSTVLVNNSGAKLKWGFDLRKVSQAMEDGILKFLHSSGVPFISDGSTNGIEGELEPGQTMPITIVFCPSEYSPFSMQFFSAAVSTALFFWFSLCLNEPSIPYCGVSPPPHPHPYPYRYLLSEL